uniref:Uncharacterized protein n=1 Tax=mine drainage metagenome TaxID=410659 RepID=E6QPC1_9ZZZZ
MLPEDLDESRAIRREVAAAARELGMEARDAALDPLVDASTAVATDEPRGVPALEAAAAAYAAAMKGSSLDYEAARLDLHSSVLRALSDGSEAPTPVQRALALGFSGAVSGPNRTESSTEQVRATAFVAQDLARMPGEDLARRLGVEQYDLPPILMNSFTLLALGKEMNQAADRVELAERAASQCRIVQPGEYHERSGAFVGVSPQAGIAVVRAEDGLWGYRDAELFAGVQPGEQVRATMTPDGLSVEGPAELEQETSGHVAIVSQAAEAGD